MPRRDGVIEGRGDFYDGVRLDVELEHAPDAAVRTHRLRHMLLRLVPRTRDPHVVLALEHQGAGRAHPDAVAAVDTRGIRQRRGELCRDVRIEAPAGDADRERVLRVDTARLDALVAEDAARVVAHVQLVVDLHRLGDGRGPRTKT